MAFGDQQPFVAAMVAIDMSTVGKWAEQHEMPYTSYVDLTSKADVATLILDEVRKINSTLPDATQGQAHRAAEQGAGCRRRRNYQNA